MDYYKIIHPATGKVVNLYSTDSSSAVANGTRLLLYTWLDNNDQKWGLDYVGDLVLMRLARDNSKVMNRHSGNNNAIVWYYDGQLKRRRIRSSIPKLKTAICVSNWQSAAFT